MIGDFLRATPLGKFYLVVALLAVTLITGMATGFGLFYRLAYVLVAAAALSYLWNWLTVRSLEVKVERRTRQTRVGDNVEETITVRSHSRLPKNSLEVEDLTDLPGYFAGMAINLEGNTHNTWSVKMPARKRGVYTLGPVRVANSDPFGLFRRFKIFGNSDALTVYPYTFDLPGFAVPPADLSGDSSSRKRTYHVTPHASSVREYASGDSLSRVHWNSTARLGKLMSKVFDMGRSGDIWVLVDLHKDVQAGEMEGSTDEYAVSIGASLAKRYLETEQPVGLIAHGEQRYYLPAETGAGQLHRILQYLAVSRAEGSTPLEVVLPKEEPLWSLHSSLIVITPSPRPDWVIALRELAKRGVKVVVVLLDGRSFGGFLNTLDVLEHLYLSGLPTYVVRKDDNIPASLSRTYSPTSSVAAQQKDEVASSV